MKWCTGVLKAQGFHLCPFELVLALLERSKVSLKPVDPPSAGQSKPEADVGPEKPAGSKGTGRDGVERRDEAPEDGRAEGEVEGETGGTGSRESGDAGDDQAAEDEAGESQLGGRRTDVPDKRI